jgi:FtsP/CotA-like multicopper oxidase with cupredoxin domain
VDGAPRRGDGHPGVRPAQHRRRGAGACRRADHRLRRAADLDILGYGTPAPGPFERYHKDYTLVLDRLVRFLDGLPSYAYTVNGSVYPDIPPLMVDRGDAVRTTVVNRGTESHPMHLHGHHVLVLSRDGRPVTGSPLWLDTFDVLPGEVWQVAFRADNPGIWLDHCHNLPHAKQGMVLHLAYRGVTSPFAIGRRTPNHPE